MSLLLDALKKAADDKQKVSQDAASTEVLQASNQKDIEKVTPVVKSDEQSPAEELSLQAPDAQQNITEPLSLDNVDAAVETAEHDADINNLALDETEVEAGKAAVDGDDEGSSTLTLQNIQKAGKTNAREVSDEALSLLINKTNRDIKQGNRIFIVSMLITALIVIVLGGVYYYLDMQAEIASLERKHRIAMQSMRAKTNSENSPDESSIIRNLTSDAAIDDKVQYAKKHMADEKQLTKVKQKAVSKPVQSANPSVAGLSIKKTNKTDPLAEKLELAWQAYEGGRYNEAKKSYGEVLVVEKNNRDALLGVGAIAIKEKNNVMAKRIYMSLLKLDPRDPIAVAALASLHNDEASLKTDEEYILSMLQKNPDAAHLNFALGNIYAQQSRWKLAQQSYFAAWQHDEENAEYIFNLAISLDQLGKSQQALKFYKDSLLKSVNKQVSFSREAVQKRINDLSEM